MTFLPPDDHMLVMNVNPHQYNKHGPCVSLTKIELACLRGVGVQTVMQYGIWSELAEHGWGYLDRAVGLARSLGMRSLIWAYHCAPTNLPKEWYCWKPDNTVGLHSTDGSHVLSLWNMEARATMLRHIGEIANRYPRDAASVVFGGMGAGEIVLPSACFYEPAALKSLAAEVVGRPDPTSLETRAWVHRAAVEFYTTTNATLLHQHNQTWNAMSFPALKNNECGGVGAQEDIFAAEYERWPDADRYLLQYTYWKHTKNGYKRILDGWRNKYKLQMIVEADHCSGLPRTAPLAIAAGMRGQLVGPVHPCAGTLKLESAHIDAIGAAIKLWESA